MLLAFGFSPAAFAESNAGAESKHYQTAPKARPAEPSSRVKYYKLDQEVTRRAKANPKAFLSVILTLKPGKRLPAELRKYAKGNLNIINGMLLELPNGLIRHLEASSDVVSVHYNRETQTSNYRTSVTVGAATARAFLGYTGAGVGIAVIDSGIAFHNDLRRGGVSTTYPYGDQRVSKFVDFVNGRTTPYDDNGHGTHVAGIIAGNGQDSRGEKAGVAPKASLVSLKVLDASGRGTIGHIIAALDWIVANHKTHNIRVVNMSVGAGVYESYWTDPLTLATKRVNDLGITVVAAAGNMGKSSTGGVMYGSITAPGNAPWVLTVGASSTMGTFTRYDDKMAAFSSAGPTFLDFGAKPDLVAPGAGSISLSVPGSTFYLTKLQYLVNGSPLLGIKPYLALSGTSMSAPVVSGSVALMLQANPKLTPNLIKAILQYTAQRYPNYNALRQGAGFLNTLGAVRLAKFYADNRVGERMPIQSVWSRQIIWGNHRLSGGYINPQATAWTDNVVWGTAWDAAGDNVVWGTDCPDSCDNVVWGTADANGDNVVWGTEALDNVVWGTEMDGDNIVWGTALDDNIVWGTDCGGADCDNVVWGTADVDNVVWGTAADGDNVVWGTSGLDNVVWGTSGADEDDVTWGSADNDDAVFYPEDIAEPLPNLEQEFGEIVPIEPLVDAVGETVVEPVTDTVDQVIETVTSPVTTVTSALLGGI
jgi:serine protease AprX